ncbi:hypothetical protein [Priestia megaterium]|uniref:hypothetical protein n=1 Tax=Priestia megaterium TaxID=1404 RepID=UPI00064C5AE1|nr:hypothetical protein [Priestia megaterium]KLV28627.1 hypothetical protein ABW04_28875 [Priestia megaterium]
MQNTNDFSIRENKIYIQDITLGDKEKLVIDILGEPNTKEEDDAGDLDYYLVFNNLSIGIIKNTVVSLIIEIKKEIFVNKFNSIQSEEKYKNQAGDLYLYNKPSEQLLFSKEIDDKFIRVYLTYKDNNINFSSNDEFLTKLS